MRPFLSRALSCARTTDTPLSISQQFSHLRLNPASVAQTASISYKPNPLASKPTPKTATSKIPPSRRPLSREPTPPPTITAEVLESMPYIIRRTPFAQLPIYRKWMAGGTKQVVIIKKINGNRQALVQELVDKLQVETDRIRINPTTGHLELKGDYFDKTRKYLLDRGF